MEEHEENPLCPAGGNVFVNAAGERFVEVREGVFVAEPQPLTEEERRELEARYRRPQFSPLRIALQAGIPLLAAAGLAAALYCILRAAGAGWGIGPCVGIAAGALGLYVLLRLRSVIIFGIRCYQKFAPMRVRERCHMTPTCSTYMIRALEKYGLFRGLRKGCARLYRCRGQDEVDEP